MCLNIRKWSIRSSLFIISKKIYNVEVIFRVNDLIIISIKISKIYLRISFS